VAWRAQPVLDTQRPTPHVELVPPRRLALLAREAVGELAAFVGEQLCPVQDFAFGLVGGLPIGNGVARLPEGPGLGRELDWALIEDATLLRL